jgi:hypothetical protein
MIKNFNFYDVYGYFLPGFTLLALIWLPFGLFHDLLPQPELSSALAVVVFGYIVGHLLQILAAPALPSTIKETWKRRLPSEVMLDDDTFTPEFKEDLKRRVVAQFGDKFSGEKFSSRRQEAFLLCRSFLIQHKVAAYVEQAEGMYVLMRGLTAAFVCGAIYHTGWALAGLFAGWGKAICIAVGASLFLSIFIGMVLLWVLQRRPAPTIHKWLNDPEQLQRSLLQYKPAPNFLKWLTKPEELKISLQTFSRMRDWLAVLFSLFTLLAIYYFGLNRWSWKGVGVALAGTFLALLIPEFKKSPKGIRVWFLDLLAWLKVAPIAFALLALGYSSGLIKETSLNQRAWLLGIALASLFASLKFYSSYLFFAQEFPKAIYRDFVAYEESKKKEESEDEEED